MTAETIIAEFTVTSTTERDAELTQAIAAAKARATVERKHGILITRTNFWRFKVSLTPQVPYGFTHELDHAKPS